MAKPLLGYFQTTRRVRVAVNDRSGSGYSCSCAVLVLVLDLLVVGTIRGSCHVNVPVPDTRLSRCLDHLRAHLNDPHEFIPSNQFAVGTPVARRPPRGSQRAAITALGSCLGC
jgi:hypothetical protein